MHKRPALVEAPGGFVPMPTSLKQVLVTGHVKRRIYSAKPFRFL